MRSALKKGGGLGGGGGPGGRGGEHGGGGTASRNDVTFFRVLMPRWETALLPWVLLCSLGRFAWGGDKIDMDGHRNY